jgi:hypothetical protein
MRTHGQNTDGPAKTGSVLTLYGLIFRRKLAPQVGFGPARR